MSLDFGNGFVTTVRRQGDPMFDNRGKTNMKPIEIDPAKSFKTTNRPDHMLQNMNAKNKSSMEGVSVLPATENCFTQAYTGISDLNMSESQFMHNKTQQIIDAVSRFNQALKEAARHRNVDLTDDEAEHMNAEAIPSSLSSVFMHQASLNPTVVDMDKHSKQPSSMPMFDLGSSMRR